MEVAAFTGEHLLLGQLGRLCIVSSFIFALASAFSLYLVHSKSNKISVAVHQQIGITLFAAQGVALLASFLLLLYIIFQHYFEYKYVWQHSSTSLPFKYLLSCIWEGQEGSLILWGIWHWVIGLWILVSKQIHRTALLFIICIFQAMISSMLLGITIGDVRIGSDPFILMREHFENAPIFSQSNYLSLLNEGQGLNELLQNYWMVIHPPILFLGYALSIVPFAYACAALWKKEFIQSIQYALKWSLLAAAVLGLGIMLGGVWAYESLSFGGYWAWDPVENASLVPWLCLVAAIHAALISIHRKKAYHTSLFFFALGFIFVLYSSYLTRSGILGDTSVHSFTDLEMTGQLILMLIISSGVMLFLWIKYKAYIPKSSQQKEENLSSRELWLSIGSIIIILSAAYIILGTSLPVLNNILGKKWSMGSDVPFAYNRVLIFSAALIMIVSSAAFLLRYKKTSKATLGKSKTPLVIIAGLALILTLCTDFLYTNKGTGFLISIYIAFFASLFSLLLHLYLISKRRAKQTGALLSHIGFATLLVGILLSSANRQVMSYNYSGFSQDFGEGSDENPLENTTLIQGLSTPMPPYTVTYLGDSIGPADDSKTYFRVAFEDSAQQSHFVLLPNAFINNDGQKGLLSNPDVKHYWTYDVFSYVTSIPDKILNKPVDTSMQFLYGDTLFLSMGYISLEEKDEKLLIKGADKYLVPFKKIVEKVPQKLIYIQELNTDVTLIVADGEKVTIKIRERQSNDTSYITLKVYKFPHINLVWLGIVLLFIGFITAWYNRKPKLSATL